MIFIDCSKIAKNEQICFNCKKQFSCDIIKKNTEILQIFIERNKTDNIQMFKDFTMSNIFKLYSEYCHEFELEENENG